MHGYILTMMVGDEGDISNSLQFPDNLFGCKLGICLGREIVRRHEARCHFASDETAGLQIRGYGRAPMLNAGAGTASECAPPSCQGAAKGGCSGTSLEH